MRDGVEVPPAPVDAPTVREVDPPGPRGHVGSGTGSPAAWSCAASNSPTSSVPDVIFFNEGVAPYYRRNVDDQIAVIDAIEAGASDDAIVAGGLRHHRRCACGGDAGARRHHQYAISWRNWADLQIRRRKGMPATCSVSSAWIAPRPRPSVTPANDRR